MKIAFWGDSLTEGWPGSSFFSILEKKFPEHQLLNFGRAGDTTITLYKRLIHANNLSEWDMAFLWIGTNDVFYYGSKLYKANEDHFKSYYFSIIHALLKQTGKIILIPPLITEVIPEVSKNRLAKKFSWFISKQPHHFKQTKYLDLRTGFNEYLTNNPQETLTIDGVHLNDKGAYLIAEWIAKKITEETNQL